MNRKGRIRVGGASVYDTLRERREASRREGHEGRGKKVRSLHLSQASR
ncbi:MAG: hypothetical protein HEQ35_20770 [Gloeotrichia echinulata IR180]